MANKPKSNSVLTYAYDSATDSIKFVVIGAGELVLRIGETSPACRKRAMIHGYGQRVSDKAALPHDKTTGKAPTPQQKLDAMRTLVDHYNSGTEEWSPARVTIPADPFDPIMLAAVCEVVGKAEDVMRLKIENDARDKGVTPKSYLTVLASSAKVAPIVQRMRDEAAARLAGDLNGDDLLDGMMVDAEEGDGEDDAE